VYVARIARRCYQLLPAVTKLSNLSGALASLRWRRWWR